jgi:hypothetical protein
MDADVLLISPDSLYPRGQWISFTNSDGGCYNVDASRTYKQRVAFLKKEVDDCLNAGKNVFVLATKEEEYQLAGGVSSLRKGEHTYQTERYSNYNFLPISIGDLTSASGRHIEFSGNTIFSDFYEKFKDNLEYHLYIENPQNSQIIFTGKDKTKVLGTVYKVKNGHLVVLPYVKYDEKKFITYNKKEDKSYWTADAIKFGKILTKAFIDIDKALRSVEDKTPPPNWINNPPFLIEKEEKLKEAINENDNSRKRFEILSREVFKRFKACITIEGINNHLNSIHSIIINRNNTSNFGWINISITHTNHRHFHLTSFSNRGFFHAHVNNIEYI